MECAKYFKQFSSHMYVWYKWHGNKWLRNEHIGYLVPWGLPYWALAPESHQRARTQGESGRDEQETSQFDLQISHLWNENNNSAPTSLAWLLQLEIMYVFHLSEQSAHKRLIANILTKSKPSLLCLSKSNILGIACLLWPSQTSGLRRLSWIAFPQHWSSQKSSKSCFLTDDFQQKYKQQKVVTTVSRTPFLSHCICFRRSLHISKLSSLHRQVSECGVRRRAQGTLVWSWLHPSYLCGLWLVSKLCGSLFHSPQVGDGLHKVNKII